MESTWKAINELTNKNTAANSSRTKDISANELNAHFSTIADRVIYVNRTESNDLCVLKEFCDIKHIVYPSCPPMTITEVYNALIDLKQTGTRALDGLDGKILKLSAPVISDTLTYAYNLSCYVPAAFKQAKIIPVFKSGLISIKL